MSKQFSLQGLRLPRMATRWQCYLFVLGPATETFSAACSVSHSRDLADLLPAPFQNAGGTGCRTASTRHKVGTLFLSLFLSVSMSYPFIWCRQSGVLLPAYCAAGVAGYSLLIAPSSNPSVPRRCSLSVLTLHGKEGRHWLILGRSGQLQHRPLLLISLPLPPQHILRFTSLRGRETGCRMALRRVSLSSPGERDRDGTAGLLRSSGRWEVVSCSTLPFLRPALLTSRDGVGACRHPQ